MPTVRFSKLVEESGKPQPVTLWTDPHQDHKFMKAVKEHRVVTLKQEPAAKTKDFGKVGFFQEPHVSYLVFPEPLKIEPETHVVGLKYDLLGEPEVRDPVAPADLKPPPKKEPKHKPPGQEKQLIEPVQQEPEAASAAPIEPEPPMPKPERVVKDFTASVRRVAVVETTVQIRARNKKEAKQRAVVAVEQEPFDLSKAVIKNEVKRLQ